MFSFSKLIAIIPDLEIYRIADNIPTISNHPWQKLPKILDMRKNTESTPPISTSILAFCGFLSLFSLLYIDSAIHMKLEFIKSPKNPRRFPLLFLELLWPNCARFWPNNELVVGFVYLVDQFSI